MEALKERNTLQVGHVAYAARVALWRPFRAAVVLSKAERRNNVYNSLVGWALARRDSLGDGLKPILQLVKVIFSLCLIPRAALRGSRRVALPWADMLRLLRSNRSGMNRKCRQSRPFMGLPEPSTPDSRSRRRVACQPGHAVEVGVVAGQVHQSVLPHHGDDQGIATEQAKLLTDDGRRGHLLRSDRQELKTGLLRLVNGAAKKCEFLNFRGVPPQPLRNRCGRPPENLHGLDRHQPMGQVAQNIRGGEARQRPAPDPLDELGTSGAKLGMLGKVKNERVGVDKDPGAGGRLDRIHRASRTPNSGSRAMRSRVSGSPVHRISPAVRCAQLALFSTVTCTVSFSFSGNGRWGFSTPP